MARPGRRSSYLGVVLGRNWLAEMLWMVLLAGWAAARASVLLRPEAGTKETLWKTCSLGVGFMPAVYHVRATNGSEGVAEGIEGEEEDM
jgi:hypothetical protein